MRILPLIFVASLLAAVCTGAIAQAPALPSQVAALPSGLPPGFNYTESQAAGTLLDPLQRADGSEIRSRAEWRRHRAHLLHAFAEDVYGNVPEAARHLPLRYKVVEQDASALNGLAVRRQVDISLVPGVASTADAPVMHLLLYLPAAATGRVPVIVGLNFQGNASVSDDPDIRATPVWQAAARRGDPPVLVPFAKANRGAQRTQWQVKLLLQRGYGFATVYYGDIEPDYKNALSLGVRARYLHAGEIEPAQDAWGAISAWAWGLPRALDYLWTGRNVNQREIVVTGHSRLGKAADWAAAQDERFAALLSTESGKGGQSLYRRNFGENVAHLEHSFPYWFCGNFAQWVGRDAQMPVDGNLLLALIAPRPLYVASAHEDLFSDPRGEFLSASSVGAVYALLGRQGLGTTTMPPIDRPIQHGVAYHVRTGVHDVTAYDWQQYLNFLDQQFGSPKSKEVRRSER